MRKDITLSPKHGVNPSLELCFFCGKDKGTIALLGRLPGDEKAPTRACYDRVPCDECAEYMRENIIILSADPHRTVDPRVPYRTGGFAVIKESAMRNIIKDASILSSILEKRFAFMDDLSWKALGLPDVEDIPTDVN